MFVLWFWLFVSVASDLFRRHDISGWAKVLWVIALILFSYIGIFALAYPPAIGGAACAEGFTHPPDRDVHRRDPQ